jgi:hypothetical protein
MCPPSPLFHSCKAQRNLNSFFAIVMGLNTASVSRLSQTWEVSLGGTCVCVCVCKGKGVCEVYGGKERKEHSRESFHFKCIDLDGLNDTQSYSRKNVRKQCVQVVGNFSGKWSLKWF